MESLLTKYRPRTLADVLGQPSAVAALTTFAADPYPCAFLFSGETGTGKTSAAHALARDLGIDVDAAEVGGLFEIASGELSADAVRAAMKNLHYCPMFSAKGWRMLVCNECDRQSPAAETVWLDALENLPSRSIVIFTTNRPEKLSQRFRDRCELLAFTHDTESLAPSIRALAARIWSAEGLPGSPPRDDLGLPTLGDDDAMTASFRLALQQLSPLIRAARNPSLAPVPVNRLADKPRSAPNRRAAGRSRSMGWVCCDHCQKEQRIEIGATAATCAACRKPFAVEWA